MGRLSHSQLAALKIFPWATTTKTTGQAVRSFPNVPFDQGKIVGQAIQHWLHKG